MGNAILAMDVSLPYLPEAQKLLRRKHIRITLHRLCIVDLFMQTGQLLSLPEIAVKLSPSIDRATVFRTLKRLQAEGILKEIRANRCTYYRLQTDNLRTDKPETTVVFNCTQCHHSYELDADFIPVVELPGNYGVFRQLCTIRGTCRACNGYR